MPGSCHQSTGGGGGTHIHAMHAGGGFGISVSRLRGQVCQSQLSLPSCWVGTDMSKEKP